MPPEKKVKLNESPEMNLIWTDDLLLKSVRNVKTQNACGSTTLFDPMLLFPLSLSSAKLLLCFSEVAKVSGL